MIPYRAPLVGIDLIQEGIETLPGQPGSVALSFVGIDLIQEGIETMSSEGLLGLASPLVGIDLIQEGIETPGCDLGLSSIP